LRVGDYQTVRANMLVALRLNPWRVARPQSYQKLAKLMFAKA